MESLALNYFNKFIEEAWIIRSGICIFHECYIENPLDLNVQLFSAFTSAVNSFSKSTLPSETLRNIDFQNTTLVLENLPEFNLLFVIKFATISNEKQFEIINAIINEFLIYINEFNYMELFSTSNTKAIPVAVFGVSLSRFMNLFLAKLDQNEAEIRKIDLLGIVQLSETLLNMIVKSKSDLNELKIKTVKSENIFSKLLLGPGTGYLSTDTLPGLSRRELREQFSEFIANFYPVVERIKSKDLQLEIFNFFVSNFEFIKSYNLDDELVNHLLSIFVEN